MGMLFARRRTDKVEGITTTENLLRKEPKKAENVRPQPARSVPVQRRERVVDPTQPKFKVKIRRKGEWKCKNGKTA